MPWGRRWRLLRDVLRARLELVEPAVEAVLGQQLLVRARLLDEIHQIYNPEEGWK